MNNMLTGVLLWDDACGWMLYGSGSCSESEIGLQYKEARNHLQVHLVLGTYVLYFTANEGALLTSLDPGSFCLFHRQDAH